MMVGGSKYPNLWSPVRLPLMDANRWSSPRSGMIAMLVLLLLMCLAGVYISAVVSSSSSSSRRTDRGSSSRRISGLDKASLNKFVEVCTLDSPTRAEFVKVVCALDFAFWISFLLLSVSC